MSSTKTVINAESNSVFLFSEILNYKSLLINLAKRDFLVRYKQAVAGILWALIKPLINILVFGYIASKINSTENPTTNFLYVSSAMLLWQLFASVFNDVSGSVINNSNLFSKVYFPKIIIPLSSIFVCLIDFLISLVILAIIFIISGQNILWQILLVPIFIAFTLLNGFGIGLYFATINVKFRDVKFIVPVILQVGMYVSPVVFSVSFYIKELHISKSWEWLMFLNPMVGAIEGFKYCLFGSNNNFEIWYYGISLAVSLIMLTIGVKYFYKFERNFVDYI